LNASRNRTILFVDNRETLSSAIFPCFPFRGPLSRIELSVIVWGRPRTKTAVLEFIRQGSIGHRRSQPIEHALVVKGAGLGLVMPIGPLFSREPNEDLGTNQRVINFLGLPGPELLVIGIGNEQGTLNLLDYVPSIVLPYLLKQVIVALRCSKSPAGTRSTAARISPASAAP
jgi:hypothetical protein